MRIVLASGNDSFRRALRLLLQFRPGFDVVGEANDQRELVGEIDRGDPELVLLDEDINELPFAELIATLHKLDASPAVIVFSENMAKAEAAMNAGASGFVLKGDPPNRLYVTLENIRLKDGDEKRADYHDFFQSG